MISLNQPVFVGNGLNSKSLVRFDGADDYLIFDEINTLRTLFMVVEQESGNTGFLLGHETSYAFHSGASSAWSQTWTDPTLLNGLLYSNGNLLEGIQQNHDYDKPVLIALQSTGMVSASNFSRDRENSVNWKGDLAELIIYNEPIPLSAMRQVEGYLAHKWGISDSLVGTHPYKLSS